MIKNVKASHRRLTARECNHAHGLSFLLRPACGITVDIKYAKCTTMSHTLLCNDQDLSATLVECDTLSGSGKLPHEQALACLHIPQAHLVISRSCHKQRCFSVNIHGPHSTVVSVVRAEPLTIVREPHVHKIILRYREQQITFAVELDLVQRTCVSR